MIEWDGVRLFAFLVALPFPFKSERGLFCFATVCITWKRRRKTIVARTSLSLQFYPFLSWKDEYSKYSPLKSTLASQHTHATPSDDQTTRLESAAAQ